MTSPEDPKDGELTGEDFEGKVQPGLAVDVDRVAPVLVRVGDGRRLDLERVPVDLESAGSEEMNKCVAFDTAFSYNFTALHPGDCALLIEDPNRANLSK